MSSKKIMEMLKSFQGECVSVDVDLQDSSGTVWFNKFDVHTDGQEEEEFLVFSENEGIERYWLVPIRRIKSAEVNIVDDVVLHMISGDYILYRN